MSRRSSECFDRDPSERWESTRVFLRQPPDDEEDEEEDGEGNGRDDDDEDNEDENEGYSVMTALRWSQRVIDEP